MALIEENSPQKPKEKEPFVSERPYNGIEVHSERLPVSQVAKWVKGTPWTVDYYRALKTKAEDAVANQTTVDPVNEQLQLIEGLVLRVTSALSPSFNEQTGEHRMEGQSNIPPYGFKPNVGDTIVADIGDGRAAWMTVNRVEQPNIFADGAYIIDYSVNDFMTEAKHYELRRKVVVHTHFVEGMIGAGASPLVESHDFNDISRLRAGIGELQRFYFNDCWNQTIGTFLLPKQTTPTYDPFLVKIFDYIFPLFDRPADKPMTKYMVGNDPCWNLPTLWDCLCNRDTVLFERLEKEFDTISSRNIKQPPELGAVRYTRIERVMFPKNRNLGDSQYDTKLIVCDHQEIESPYSEAERHDMDLRYAIRRKILNGLDDVKSSELYIPLIHPVGIDKYYVLSEYFYTKAEYGQSRLELLTWDMLQNKKPDRRYLVELLNDVRNWGPMEVFYYVPVLIRLITYSVGENK